ncbi:MAG: hypothetical protein ABIM30_05980 [candidate division WOR-3 bacterium]
MKLRRILIKFAQPLTQKVFYQNQWVTQEEILFADIEGIKERTLNELKKVLRATNTIRFVNPIICSTFSVQIEQTILKFDKMVHFKKIDDTTYSFIYPADVKSLFQFKDIASKLGPFKKLVGNKLDNIDFELLQLINEKKLIHALEIFTFKEMKLPKGSWSFQKENISADLADEKTTNP